MSSINTSLSGMQAATQLMEVSAQNTANINTDGYEKISATVNEGANGDVVVDVARSSEPDPTYQVQGTDEVEGSNVDYVDEAVDQISAQRMFEANLAAVKTADEMEESLLDVLA